MPSSTIQYTVLYKDKETGEVKEQAYRLADYGNLWEPARDAAFRAAQAINDLGHHDVTVRVLKHKVIHTFGSKAT